MDDLACKYPGSPERDRIVAWLRWASTWETPPSLGAAATMILNGQHRGQPTANLPEGIVPGSVRGTVSVAEGGSSIPLRVGDGAHFVYADKGGFATAGLGGSGPGQG